MKLYFSAEVQSSLERVKSGFDQSLFLALKPPMMALKILRFDGCKPGDEVHLLTGMPGFLQKWVSVISEAQDTEGEWSFVDEGRVLPFPLKKWRHLHRVIRISASESRVVDDIEFESGSTMVDALLAGPLWLAFSVRPRVYRKVFGSKS